MRLTSMPVIKFELLIIFVRAIGIINFEKLSLPTYGLVSKFKVGLKIFRNRTYRIQGPVSLNFLSLIFVKFYLTKFLARNCVSLTSRHGGGGGGLS